MKNKLTFGEKLLKTMNIFMDEHPVLFAFVIIFSTLAFIVSISICFVMFTIPTTIILSTPIITMMIFAVYKFIQTYREVKKNNE